MLQIWHSGEDLQPLDSQFVRKTNNDRVTLPRIYPIIEDLRHASIPAILALTKVLTWKSSATPVAGRRLDGRSFHGA